MYVCMYIHMYICMYVCMYVWLSLSLSLPLSLSPPLFNKTKSIIYMYVRAEKTASVRPSCGSLRVLFDYVYLSMCVCIYIYIYIYLYKCIVAPA